MLGFHGISFAPISALVQALEGSIVGSTSFAFSPSGTLVGSGALAGSTAVAFSTSAFGNVFVPIAGSSAFAFALAGTLKGAGALSGLSSVTFTTSGSILGLGLMSGAVTVTFTTTAIGTPFSNIAGAIALTFTTAASIGYSIAVFPYTGTDTRGAHEYYPWHNKDGVTVYFNKGGVHRKRYFPLDLERQDVLVRKRLAIENPTVTQELDWDVYNFFDVTLNADVTFTFSNPRDNSDFVILLTKDSNGTTRNVTFPGSLVWPDGNSFTALTVSGESKLIRISYFGGRYRATLY